MTTQQSQSRPLNVTATYASDAGSVSTIIDTILLDGGALNPAVESNLHRILSDMKPHEALLAIALTARTVARHYLRASPGMTALYDECREIAQYYPPEMQEAEMLRSMARCAQDLDIIAELLELNLGFLSAKHRASQSLCRLLAVQARAQAHIAEEFDCAWRLQDGEKPSQDSVRILNNTAPHAAIAIARTLDPDCGKIVAFPLTGRH